jgi:Rieske Fe-S protein
VTARDGSPLQLPAGPAVVEGEWANVPVLVFKVDSAELAGADATPSIAVPGEPGLRLFVLSAKSTHLGCTVGYLPGITGKAVLPANPDAPHILLDVCHQGQWDPFHDGRPLRGPAPARLAGLDVAFKGGALVGDGFDGPVGPQPRA